MRYVRKLAVLFVVSAIAVLAWFAADRKSDSDDRSVVPPIMASPTPSSDPQFSRQSVQITSALVSQDAATVWASGATPPVAPKGTVVDIDNQTFVANKEAARVDATVRQPGKPTVTCRLLLQREGDKWLVYAMEEVK